MKRSKDPSTPLALHAPEVLPECAVQFGHLDERFDQIAAQLDRLHAELTTQGQQLGRTQQIMSVAWQELRDDIRPALRTMPAAIGATWRQHTAECPALRQVLRRAEGAGGAPEVPPLPPALRRLPRWLMYLFGGLGGGAAVLLSLLDWLGCLHFSFLQ